MSSIIIDKPSIPTWLKPVECEKNNPKKLWELHLIIPSDKDSVFGRTVLNTVPESGLFSERVKMTIWTSSSSPGDFSIDTDVDGTRSTGSIDMVVHIFGSSIRFDPMTCIGEENVDGTCYEGGWTMPCMRPKTCGCEGLSGTFSLSEL